MSVTSSALLRPGPPASKPTGRDLPRHGGALIVTKTNRTSRPGRADRAVQKMRAAVQKMTVALDGLVTSKPRPNYRRPSACRAGHIIRQNALVVVTGNFLHEHRDPAPQGGIINSHERSHQP